MITAQSVKTQIQSLIDQANAKTGGTDTDLTSAVGTLVAGYGQGESTENIVDITPLIGKVEFSSNALKTYTDDISLNLVNAITIASIFDNKIIKFNKLSITISSICTTFQNAFRAASVTNNTYKNLKIIEIKGDTSGVTTFINAFTGRTDLEEIQGVLNFSSANSVTNTFNNCPKLIKIQMFKNSLSISCNLSSSPLLSNESIQSIIDGLATVETSQTLTLHADVKAKLTEEQLTTITSKNWTLA